MDYRYHSSSPAISGGVVYFVAGASPQRLYAVDISTFATLWNLKLGSGSQYELTSTPAVGDGIIAVGTGEGALME